MYTVVISGEYDYRKRLFALCEKCYWTATFLKNVESYQCPICCGEKIALIPICHDEKYEYSLEPKQGLQVRFSLLKKEIAR